MAEQNNTLHKGWLTTRDGAKFAPATLIENVFSRDGTSYDTKIKEYIQNEIQDVDGDLTEAVQTINNRVNTLNSKVDNSVQALENKDTAIENKLSNFGDEQGDKLYIVDKDDKVIAYVDQNGVTSTNFIVPGVTNFQAEYEAVEDLKERMQTAEGDIDDIETALRNIDVDADDDTFYIIDSQENVIAYINEEGVHSINFIIDNEDSEYANYLALLEKVESHIEEIQGLKETDGGLRQDLTDFANAVNKELQHFNGDEDEAFFFIDNEENVIAYIDQYGIHTTGLYATDSGLTVENTLYVYNKNGEKIFTATFDDGISATNFLVKAADGTVIYNLVNTLKSLIQEDERLSEALGVTNQKLNDEITDRAEEDGKLQKAIDDTNARTEYIDGTNDEAFYVIDKADNVIAYINDDGVHSTNFLIDDQKGTVHNVKNVIETLINEGELQQSALTSLNQALQKEVNDRIADVDQEEKDRKDAVLAEAQAREKAVSDEADARATADETLQSNINNEAATRLRADNTLQQNIDATNQRTAHVDGTEDERLYVVDKDNNVVAYIDEVGVHAIEFITEPYTTGENPRVTRYEMTELGDSVEALEVWQPSAQREINRNEDDITRLYGMVGEDRAENIADGHDHKSRLDKIDDILDLESFAENGKSNRLDRLDTIVGQSDDDTSQTTHEGRLKTLEEGLATEANTRFQTDVSHKTAIEGLEAKTEYLKAISNDKFYIIDPSDNVIAYFDEKGLTVTELTATGLKINALGRYEAIYDGSSPYSLSHKLAEIFNTLLDHGAKINSNNDRIFALETIFQKQTNGTFQEYERIKNLLGQSTDTAAASGSHESRIKNLRNDLDDVEERLDNVSNVMDFIGSFNTYDELLAYENPNSGDVAVVASTSTEYVYNNNWIELGNSSATQTAIANLQEIVGETKLSGSTSHKTRLAKLENDVNILNSTTGENINYLYSTINYRGRFTTETIGTITPHLGDLAHIDSILKIYNYEWDSTNNILIYSWQPYSGLSRKLYNVDGSDDDTLYVTDKRNNVIATFDINGLTTVDLRLLKTNGQFTSKSTMMFMDVTDEDKYTLN